MYHKSLHIKLSSIVFLALLAVTLQAAFSPSATALAANQAKVGKVLITAHATQLYSPDPEIQKSWEAAAARYTGLANHLSAAAIAAGSNAQALETDAARWTAMGLAYPTTSAKQWQAGWAAGTTKLSDTVMKDISAVRRATVGFHDVEKAIAAGYLPTETCVAEPGVGAMGYHYVNPALIMDPAIVLEQPEVLLYAQVYGKLRLVGVEYFLPIGAPDAPIPAVPPPAPVLFERNFDGPMDAHEPGQPPHYDFHVWLWQANPLGMFFPLNSSITCN